MKNLSLYKMSFYPAKWWGLTLTILLCLSLQHSVLAEEGLGIQREFDFNHAALKAATLEAAPDADGSQKASVYGKVILHYGDGLTETKGAIFHQSFSNEKYSKVSVKIVDEATFLGNNLWLLIAAALVFIMHLGFAMVESGMTQAKNTTNILFKNLAVLSIGLLSYALIGFNLMYPGEWNFIDKVLGFSGFGLAPGEGGLTALYNPGYTYWTDFLFQAMFAATAATIVSGAVAERIRLGSFLVFAALFVSFVYPVIGSWQWGGGFLAELGFYDFAGSTLVHAVGGWGALAGALLLGPRLGKYVNGTIKAIPGSNMPTATLGVFLLWLGWFGFNGGSVLSADPGGVSYVLVTTCLAAAAGTIAAIVLSWLTSRSPDLSMSLNGALAGLVSITAGADVVSLGDAVLIGSVGGLLVVLSVLLLDRLYLDDPVGAISVHLTCGIWGTIAVGIFSSNAEHKVLSQLVGVGAAALLAFPAALLLFGLLRLTIGLRVSREDEQKGLDISEHKQEAYSGFQIFNTR